jgi:glycosyltransferase involved in cell wall biosynthesis
MTKPIYAKKVLLVNSNRAWGGGEKWHLEAGQWLMSQGFEVHYLVHSHGELATKIKPPLHLTKINLNIFFWFNPFQLFKVKKLFKRFNPSLVIMNSPLDIKTISFFAKWNKTPMIFYRRGMPHPYRNTFINRYIGKNNITLFIANSLAVKESLQAGNPWLTDDRLMILPNVIDGNFKIKKPDFKKIRLGNLGRLVSQKGQIHLIEIALMLKNKGVSFEMIIAGEGELYSSLQEEIKKNSLQDEVILAGQMKSEDFFKRIDLFLFPSLFEGFSNAVLESLEAGVPVIASNISPNIEIMKDIDEKALINPKLINQWYEKIMSLHLNPDQYEKIQIKSQEIMKEKYLKEKIYKNFFISFFQ